MFAYIQVIGFGILLALFLTQILGSKERVLKLARLLFFSSFIVVVAALIYYSYVQYAVWQGNELSRHFFADGLGYFYGYVLHRFWAQYIVSFLIGLLFFWLARRHNRRHDEKFFYAEELYIFALSLFLVGHPGWVLYLMTAIVVYISFILLYRLQARSQTDDQNEMRVSFYYGWIPVALFVILIKEAVFSIPLLTGLVFSSAHLIL